MNSPSSLKLQQEFIIFANSLSVSRIFYKFTICLAISLWIHYLFWVTTLNSLWNHQETILKSLCYHYRFLNFTMNSPSSSRFHNEFTIYFGNSLWIHYLFRLFSMNSPSYNKFTILFAKSLWIHFLFRESTFNEVSVSRHFS